MRSTRFIRYDKNPTTTSASSNSPAPYSGTADATNPNNTLKQFSDNYSGPNCLTGEDGDDDGGCEQVQGDEPDLAGYVIAAESGC
jgi:hypothetical protein